MTLTKQHLLTLIASVSLLALAYVLGAQTLQTHAAGGFLPSTMASTSVAQVTSTASLVAATSSPNCASRIIGTASSSIMITFTDKFGDVPSNSKGFWQAASTTVVYDSGLFGCGAVKIYSFAAQQITVAETF